MVYAERWTVNGERWRTLTHERWMVTDVNPWTLAERERPETVRSPNGHGTVTVTGENQKINSNVLGGVRFGQVTFASLPRKFSEKSILIKISLFIGYFYNFNIMPTLIRPKQYLGLNINVPLGSLKKDHIKIAPRKWQKKPKNTKMPLKKTKMMILYFIGTLLYS